MLMPTIEEQKAEFDAVFPIDTPVVDIDDVIEATSALVPAQTSHVIMGMDHLARMSDDEFAANIAMLTKARERIETIQKTLMVEGEDYGKVKGIERPFLQLPGAEKLEKFYGLVAVQTTTRLLGDGVLSPPYSYRTDTTVHLGDENGPVVAVVSGVCNPWEDKYRWRWGKPKCPACGREGMIRGKPDGKLKGKWWCPTREGGCGRTFEPSATQPDGVTPLIESPGKVENDDPWSLDETIIQMSQKRSYVAAIRRATGTSGLFTIDDDSPNVQQQLADANPYGEEEPVVEVTAAPTEADTAQAGGKTDGPTVIQFRELTKATRDKDIDAVQLSALMKRLFDITVEDNNTAVKAAVQGLTGQQVGQLILSVTTGEVPEEPDPVALATYPDDIGAK
jgi:hypothetical protein